MNNTIVKEKDRMATHEGILTIGDTNFSVAVLKDGTRLLTGRSILAMMDRPYKGQYQDEYPAFIRGKNLEPYITEDIKAMLEPIPFKTIKGSFAKGFKAELLPEICDIYIKAEKEGVLTSSQIPVVRKCEIILKSLAKIGIIGLIDEATGYQDVRDRQALQKILELYIRDEYAKWTKRFPDEFYKELFRLRGWNYHNNTLRPKLIGKITNDIIYARLPIGVLDELREKNPTDSSGNRRHKHHQFLTDNIGIPDLDRHLSATIALMKVSGTWNSFYTKLNKACPVTNAPNQLDFGFFEEEE
ncbi:MAG: P63C domain-containing protein [Candidatus Riflebacteria bacterium]|nr:P63C domain-containing protein [Candidatus Riflebacteria bacterium]